MPGCSITVGPQQHIDHLDTEINHYFLLASETFPTHFIKHFSSLRDRESRKEKGDVWREGRGGQREGIYMAGAIGYGELS